MALEQTALAAAEAATIAALYGLVVYARRRRDEDFRPAKLAATLITAAAAGAAMQQAGLEVTQTAVEQRLAAYAGATILIQQAIKTLAGEAGTLRSG